jgi:prophage tail gpP-like protein
MYDQAMAENALTLTINGINYTGWTSIEVGRSMQELAGSFSLTMVDIARFEGKPAIQVNQTCKITIQDQPEDEPFTIMNGVIDTVEGSIGDSVSFSVSGRDITADLVDCSVTRASEWKNIKFEAFVTDVVIPHRLTVFLDESIDTGDNIETINYDQGTKVFELISKHAQLKQLLIYTQEDGSLLITQAKISGEPIDTAFIEGDNILSASAQADGSEIYSDYTVKGSRQSTKDDANEKEPAQVTAVITDKRVGRFRPLTILPDSETTNVSALARAKWESVVRIANAEGYTVQRQGWQPVMNQLAYLKMPTLGVDGDYLISSYKLSSDESGKRTDFQLVHPRSFTPLEADQIDKDDKDSELIADINANLAKQLEEQRS